MGDKTLKIVINTDSNINETEVSISCQHLTPEIEKIVSMMRILDMKLTGQKAGETFILDVSDVLYIDTVDKKTFIYTKDEVYETNLKLYELEEQLSRADFFRANKSCVINFRKISSLKTYIDRKIQVTMDNGEQLIISRQYTPYVKERLGVK